MKRTLGLGLLAEILLSSTLFAGSPAIAAAPSAPAGASQPAGPGLASLNACITREKRIDLAILMDESGSLANTDPSNSRVTALKQLLTGLLSKSQSVKSPTISVELDGFAQNFDQVRPFGPLDAASLPDLLSAAQRFGGKNHGNATDFGVGLSQVRERVARRAATEGTASCQAVVFFTDGKYDIGSARGDTAAANVLCRRGQVIDQLRSDGVALVAVGLGSDPATLLPKLAGAGGCGTIAASAGLFLPASNVSALLAAFDLTTAILNGGDPGKTSHGRTRRFVLGADLARLQLLLQPPGAPNTATLTAPDGSSVTLGGASRSAAQSGVKWTVATSASGYLRIDGAIVGAAQDHVGTWKLAYTSPASSATATDVVLFPDLHASFAANQVAYLGSPVSLRVGTVRQSGGPPEPAEVHQPHRLTVMLTEPGSGGTVFSGQAKVDASGFTLPYTPPSTESATSLDVFLRLDSLAPDGTTLTSVTTESPLPLRPPITYPSIQPSRIVFGTIAKGHTTTVTLTVVGGEQAGCAQVGNLVTRRLPDGVNTVTSRASDTSCVVVAKGERREVTLTITPNGAGTGQVTGQLPVTLQDSAGHDIKVNIPVTGHLIVPIDKTKRLRLFVVLLAIGVLVPLVVMYVIAWLGGRLRPIGEIRYVTIPVDVTASKVLADKPLSGADWILAVRPVPDGEADAASIAIPQGPKIDRHLSRSPFGAPTAAATARDVHVIGSAGKTRRSPQDKYSGLIPTRVDAAWLFSTSGARVPTTGEATLRGSLTILVADESSESDPLGAALASATRRLPDEAAALFDEQDRQNAQDPGSDTFPPKEGDDPRLDDRFTSDPFE